MSLMIEAERAPLRTEPDGTVRVGESRVTLDVFMTEFKLGASAEEIALNYPTISLADAYGAIGYYLRHTAEVDAYLEARQEKAQELRAEIERHQNHQQIRALLIARRAQQGG